MKKYLIFSLALTITLAAAVYQRLTGPTHPKRVSYLIDSVEYKSKLIRSGESDKDTKITLHLPINAIATLHYKRFKVNEDFSSIPFPSLPIMSAKGPVIFTSRMSSPSVSVANNVCE